VPGPRGGPKRGDPHGAPRGGRPTKPPASPEPTLPDIEPYVPEAQPIIPEVYVGGTRGGTVESPPNYNVGAFPFLDALPKRAPKRRTRPRRTTPKPKPSRRRRPATTPPRVPIPTPALQFSLTRLLGVAALVPTYLSVLKLADDAATRKSFERIYGVPFDERDQPPRDEPAPDVVGSVEPELAMPTVTITAPRPGLPETVAPVRAPAPLPAPTLLPIGIGWMPSPSTLEPFPRPRGGPRSRPTTSPYHVSFPNAPPLPLPGPGPVSMLRPGSNPFPGQPGVPTYTPPRPTPPLTGPNGVVVPLPFPLPVPKPALDRDCPKPQKRKPPQDRATCKQGTYRQLKRGILYTPRRSIPCQ
jgi:hypothetical protein